MQLIGLNDHFVAPCGYAIEPGKLCACFFGGLHILIGSKILSMRLEEVCQPFQPSPIPSSISYMIDVPTCSNLMRTTSAPRHAVKARGAPLACCVIFIDGTVRSICRPSKNQKYCYSGHKRKHGLKFQSVVTPNGIIAHLFGPIPASRHDAFMLSRSNLLREARSVLAADEKHFVFYGDPAYGKQDHILCPFKGASLSTEQELFNAQMSSVRVCVEWEFGRLTRY
ncbi:TPA: hypothetical protein N0F65_007300 [Lagenidium giganteum]|uniref:DDE Tnp4 domain-containing protein n=1 Tax=Lagenidium giganteum TaxID=4803 RepID=A0AAV2Z375_9STRA|nr:TPA: hypothetical protein N0F65_007300 [Lagenidium giganteum]